jgi:hypothetical protein
MKHRKPIHGYICNSNNTAPSIGTVAGWGLELSLWKREQISDDYLPSMRKAVLSISGNVYKQVSKISILIIPRIYMI